MILQNIQKTWTSELWKAIDLTWIIYKSHKDTPRLVTPSAADEGKFTAATTSIDREEKEEKLRRKNLPLHLEHPSRIRFAAQKYPLSRRF